MIGRTIGHYEVIERIGEGRIGAVYKARDIHLDRSVALKMLPGASVANAERRRGFALEATAVSALNHPNIITISNIDWPTVWTSSRWSTWRARHWRN